MAKRKKTNPEWEEQRRRAHENSERLRRLAEEALADLERERGGPVRLTGSNADWLRQLAEKAQAELDARNKQGT